MNILTSLGIDWTLAVHLVSFLVAYLALTQLIFKPYMRAYHEREKRTVGNEDTAMRLIQEASALQSEYEQRAKVVNTRIKATFDTSKSAALKEFDILVQAARGEAAQLLEASRETLSTEIQAARKALAAEIPNVSAAIASKLAGKDLSA